MCNRVEEDNLTLRAGFTENTPDGGSVAWDVLQNLNIDLVKLESFLQKQLNK